MPTRYQIVEKDDYGTDWALVRSNTLKDLSYDTEAEALSAAKQYLTERNCDNALAKSEKLKSSEAFMNTKSGCLLGTLDGSDWYFEDPRGNKVDTCYYELQGKTEVKVRPVPGT